MSWFIKRVSNIWNVIPNTTVPNTKQIPECILYLFLQVFLRHQWNSVQCNHGPVSVHCPVSVHRLKWPNAINDKEHNNALATFLQGWRGCRSMQVRHLPTVFSHPDWDPESMQLFPPFVLSQQWMWRWMSTLPTPGWSYQMTWRVWDEIYVCGSVF